VRTPGAGRVDASPEAVFVSLCTTLHPWEVHPLYDSIDGSWIAVSSSLALSAFPRLLAGDTHGADLVLRSAPGPAEALARMRLAANGLPTALQVATPDRALPWTSWTNERSSVCTFAKPLCDQINRILGSKVATPEIVSYDPSADEAASWWERASVSAGPCVRISFGVVFIPHAGGGFSAFRNAASAATSMSDSHKSLVLPRSDGVARGASWLHLPAYAGQISDPDLLLLAHFTVALVYAGQTRDQVTASCDQRPAPPPPTMTPRDFWRS